MVLINAAFSSSICKKFYSLLGFNLLCLMSLINLPFELCEDLEGQNVALEVHLGQA